MIRVQLLKNLDDELKIQLKDLYIYQLFISFLHPLESLLEVQKEPNTLQGKLFIDVLQVL